MRKFLLIDDVGGGVCPQECWWCLWWWWWFFVLCGSVDVPCVPVTGLVDDSTQFTGDTQRRGEKREKERKKNYCGQGGGSGRDGGGGWVEEWLQREVVRAYTGAVLRMTSLIVNSLTLFWNLFIIFCFFFFF